MNPRKLILFLLLLASTAQLAHAAFPDGWTRRVKLTTADAQIPGTETNFTRFYTQASLPAGIFTDAQADGDDIRFTSDLAGTTELPVDIIKFVPGTPLALIAVKRTITDGAADEVYCWYGKADATRPAVGDANGQHAAYDANWMVYWPLEETPAGANTILDRTVNVRHGTNVGSPTVTTLKLGAALSFDGTDDAINFTDWDPTTGDYTIVIWSDTISGNEPIIAKGRNGANDARVLHATGSIHLQVAGTSVNTLGANTLDETHHWVVSRKDSDDVTQGYKDGTAGTAGSSATSITNTEPWSIASARAAAANLEYAQCVLDEVSIHNVVRTQAWVTMNYTMTNSPATWATAGTVDNLSPETDPPTATVTAANVTTAGGTTYTFTIEYTDVSGVDVSDLNTGDVKVKALGWEVTPTFVSVDTGTDGSPRVATYSFAPPGGTWGKEDNGTFKVLMRSLQVSDIYENAMVATTWAAPTGSFTVNIATTAGNANYVVDSTGQVATLTLSRPQGGNWTSPVTTAANMRKIRLNTASGNILRWQPKLTDQATGLPVPPSVAGTGTATATVVLDLNDWLLAANLDDGATITLPEGLVTDGGGGSSAAVSAVAVTNNSTYRWSYGNVIETFLSTAANSDPGGGAIAWTGLTNIAASDLTDVTVTLANGESSQILIVTGTDFTTSHVTDNDEIFGIEGRLQIHQLDSTGNVTIKAWLVTGGATNSTEVFASDTRNNRVWPTATDPAAEDNTQRSFYNTLAQRDTKGQPTYMFGRPDFSATDARSSTTGIAIQAINNTGDSQVVNVDSLKFVLWYHRPPEVIYNYTSLTGMAPYPFFINAASSGLGEHKFTECEFRWTIEGETTITYADPRPGFSGVNRSTLEHRGAYAFIPFRNAGAKRVKCDIYGARGQLVAAGSWVDLTISANTRTALYWSSAGNDANDGLTVGAPVLTPKRLAAIDKTDAEWIAIDGSAWDIAVAADWHNSVLTGLSNVWIHQSGSGARPILKTTAAGGISHLPITQSSLVIIEDLVFDANLVNGGENVVTHFPLTFDTNCSQIWVNDTIGSPRCAAVGDEAISSFIQSANNTLSHIAVTNNVLNGFYRYDGFISAHDLHWLGNVAKNINNNAEGLTRCMGPAGGATATERLGHPQADNSGGVKAWNQMHTRTGSQVDRWSVPWSTRVGNYTSSDTTSTGIGLVNLASHMDSGGVGSNRTTLMEKVDACIYNALTNTGVPEILVTNSISHASAVASWPNSQHLANCLFLAQAGQYPKLQPVITPYNNIGRFAVSNVLLASPDPAAFEASANNSIDRWPALPTVRAPHSSQDTLKFMGVVWPDAENQVRFTLYLSEALRSDQFNTTAAQFEDESFVYTNQLIDIDSDDYFPMTGKFENPVAQTRLATAGMAGVRGVLRDYDLVLRDQTADTWAVGVQGTETEAGGGETFPRRIGIDIGIGLMLRQDALFPIKNGKQSEN